MNKNIVALIVAVLIIGSAFFYTANQKETENKKENNNNIKQETVMDYQITLKTSKGDISFKTFADQAPNTVQNFVDLAKDEFYDGLIFHRVIDGFMIQGGCPKGTGRGGPGYTFDDEIDPNSELYQGGYEKGIVAMANSGPNTNGSQFFIMVADYPLPPNYTIFGEVTEGQEIADQISKVNTNGADKPLKDIIIEEVDIKEIN